MSTSAPNMSKFVGTSAPIMSKLVHQPAFRPVLFWIASLLATAALAGIVCLLGITPAWSGTPQQASVTVSYRDLDLSTPEGANALYHRIQTAARKVCGYAGADVIEQAIWKGCYRSAIATAVAKVDSPLLTAVHSGRPAPMTAMLAK